MPIYLLRACNGVFAIKAYGGVKFPGKSFTNVYSSMLSAVCGVSGCQLSRKKCYKGVQFNITQRGFIDVEFSEKKRHVTLKKKKCQS